MCVRECMHVAGGARAPPLCVCVCVCVCERERERERERRGGEGRSCFSITLQDFHFIIFSDGAAWHFRFYSMLYFNYLIFFLSFFFLFFCMNVLF